MKGEEWEAFQHPRIHLMRAYATVTC